MSAPAPSVPGKYEILRRIAVGGMGEIFLARQRGLADFDRLVVIKRLLPDMLERSDIRTMFLDEARIVAHLVHPGIAQVYELGEEDGVPYLAMEYVPGENLARIMMRAHDRSIEVPRPMVLHVLAEMCRALDFAHHARDVAGKPLEIVHRDISPQNVMVTFHGDVKLMDFGVAKASNRGHRTEAGHIKGKLAYMAPEHLRGEDVDARADIYAAGIMIWELTLRRRLFSGRNEVETFQRALTADIPRPSSIDPDYPRDVEEIVMAALEPDAARRTATAGALAAALRDHLARSGSGPDRTDLGALVARLFPPAASTDDGAREGADAASTYRWVRAITVSAPMNAEPARPAGSAELVTRVERPTAERSTRRRGWAIGLAVGVLGIAATAAWRLMPDDAPQAEAEPEQAAIAEADPKPQAPAPITALVVAPDAAPAEPEPLPPPPITAEPRARKPAPKRATDPAPAVVKPEVAPVEPAPLPREDKPGFLIVGPKPGADGLYGRLEIDGGNSVSAPTKKLTVSPGEHELELVLAEGKGKFRATARIEPEKKTKCWFDTNALHCNSPD